MEDRIFEGIHKSYNNCLNIESPIGDGHKKLSK